MNAIKILAAAIAVATSSNVLGAQITGTVTDISGAAIEGAKITVEGSNIQVFTDAEGRFQIDDFKGDHLHLHVYSAEHVHGDREFHNISDSLTANFVLRPTRLENLLVTAYAMTSSVLESSVPVSVLEGNTLRERQEPTLGETLSGLPGVHSSYFGPVSSSPIIRGTDGPRVKIIQNGLDISDASRVGPDHNVASEVSSATQIEVLRGPATLQYGSGAIGGVVNVVDKRIMNRLPEAPEGEAEVRFDTRSDEKFGKIDLTAGVGKFALHLDAFTRETGNYEIPGFAEIGADEDEVNGTLENSAIDTEGATAGVSLINDSGYLGVAYQRLDNIYGVPGHAHEEGHEDDEGAESEEAVNIDAELERYQLAGEIYSPFPGINAIGLRSAFSDYRHVELENGEPGTLFKNKTLENRLSLQHRDLFGWHGVIGLHHSDVEYEALGEEAFTPPNDSRSLALFLVEEKRFNNIIVELGARAENTELSVRDEVTIDFGHEEHEGEPETHIFTLDEQDFFSLSLSAGAIWDYTAGYSLAVSLTHSERAPSHQELFSAGQHISTRTYDLGLAFTLDDEGEISINNDIREEISNNLDISWRKYEGPLAFSFSLFYNRVENFIFQSDSGLLAAESHEEHEEETSGEHEDEGLPVFQFRQEDANLYGLEAELTFNFNDTISAYVFGDAIKAELDDGEDLPRIPPVRLGASVDFKKRTWAGNLGITWYDDQKDTAPFETETESYTLINANLSYRLVSGDFEWTLFLKGHNLTDEEARPHTSFIKDLAPMPGRGYSFGVRTHF